MTYIVSSGALSSTPTNQPTSADNITFAVDDLCTSQRLRPVHRFAAERLMLLTVVALILIIVHGGPKT